MTHPTAIQSVPHSKKLASVTAAASYRRPRDPKHFHSATRMGRGAIRLAAVPMSVNRLINIDEVCALVGLSRTSIYERLKVQDFPGSVSLGPRTVRWWMFDVQQWLADKSKKKSNRTA